MAQIKLEFLMRQEETTDKDDESVNVESTYRFDRISIDFVKISIDLKVSLPSAKGRGIESN